MYFQVIYYLLITNFDMGYGQDSMAHILGATFVKSVSLSPYFPHLASLPLPHQDLLRNAIHNFVMSHETAPVHLKVRVVGVEVQDRSFILVVLQEILVCIVRHGQDTGMGVADWFVTVGIILNEETKEGVIE